MEIDKLLLKEGSNYPSFERDKEQWMGNWIWRSVQCLIEAPNFNPSPKWAAQRLNTSVEKIVEAFEGLERLQIIQKSNNTYVCTSNWIQLKGINEQDITKIMSAHTKLVPQITSKLSIEDKFTVQFFRGNRDLINKYSPKFMELYHQMNAEAIQLGLEDIVASQISFSLMSNQEQGELQ